MARPPLPLPAYEYKTVRGLVRGLTLLKELNQAPEGMASVAELADVTALHRTTVLRLLETLRGLGYVNRRAVDGRYELTLELLELSTGLHERDALSRVATPVMGALLEQIRWPSDLTILDGADMFIRDSTHRFSALSFERAIVGRRMPLLFSAAGRAYLAACPPAERSHLQQILGSGNDRQSPIARQPAALQRIIDRVKGAGYATNEGEWRPDSPTYAIALPIVSQERVLACLSVVFSRRAMTIDEAAEQLLPYLRKAVEEIQVKLTES